MTDDRYDDSWEKYFVVCVAYRNDDCETSKVEICENFVAYDEEVVCRHIAEQYKSFDHVEITSLEEVACAISATPTAVG